MIVQNRELGIFYGIYENAFLLWRYNENDRDGEKDRRIVLWSLVATKLLPIKVK